MSSQMIGLVDIQNLDQSSYSDCLLYKEFHQLVSIYSMCQNQDRQNQDLEKLFWIILLLLWLLCNRGKRQLQRLQPFSTCLRTCFSFFGYRLPLKIRFFLEFQKSVNLQYIMLGRWFVCTNEPASKHLMFQAFFSIISNRLRALKLIIFIFVRL